MRILENIVQKRDSSLFNVPFEYKGSGFYDKISPSQDKREITALYSVVKEISPKVICEIGTDKGGTFYLWCLAANDSAKIISMDMPSRGNYCKERRELYAMFGRTKQQQLYFLPGDSHDKSSHSNLEKVLAGDDIDFLFIDGDHTYEGCMQDYKMYEHLVKSGGIIAFHDIHTVRDNCGVKEVWEELCQIIPESDRNEFAYNDLGPVGAGIGVIYKR